MNTFNVGSMGLLVLGLLACGEPAPSEKAVAELPAATPPTREIEPAFQTILDEANLAGSILIYEESTDRFHSNDFEWSETGFLPASTFKIPNSMIALETGVVETEETMFYWDGEPRALSSWEADLTLTEAFRRSCVPCYQDIARKIGLERMRQYVDTFAYGHIVVDSVSLDQFWLRGESRISQVEQIDFLRRFVQKELPISEDTYHSLIHLMTIEKSDQFLLCGKTGWSNQHGEDNGWFVGFLMNGSSATFVATNVEPKEGFDMALFAPIRKEVSLKALAQMKAIDPEKFGE